MLHSVGCAQSSAKVFINTFNRSNYTAACVHAFIDADTGTVYQTLPWNHRGWHGGSDRNGCCNNTHIGIEMCEPREIKYTAGASFTVTDAAKARAAAQRTYAAAVELFAYLSKLYGLDPKTDIISHRVYAAYGVKACADLLQKILRADENKKAGFRRIAVQVLAVCLTLYAVLPLAGKAVRNGGYWQAHGRYAYSKDAVEMYRYIQEHVPEDSVIQCNQYRVLLQNTGRLTIHTAGDTAVADYYLHIDECSDAAGFTTEEFEEILDCGTLVLYRRK